MPVGGALRRNQAPICCFSPGLVFHPAEVPEPCPEPPHQGAAESFPEPAAGLAGSSGSDLLTSLIHVDPRSLSLWVDLGNWRPHDWKHEDGSTWLEQREAPSRLLRTQTSCPLGRVCSHSSQGGVRRSGLLSAPDPPQSGGLCNCASPSPPTVASAMRGLDPGILFLLGSRDWGTRGDDGSSSPTFKPQPTTQSGGTG